MTPDSNLSKSDSSPNDETEHPQPMPLNGPNGAGRELVPQSVAEANYQASMINSTVADSQDDGRAAINSALKQELTVRQQNSQPPYWLIILLAIAMMTTGLIISNFWLGVAGAAVAFLAP
jgi:hypothetical protein